MKDLTRHLSLQIILAGVGMMVLAGLAWAQKPRQLPPLDRTAVFRTHVPHTNAHLPGLEKPTSKPGGGGGPGGGHGGGGGGGGTCSPSGIFTCTQYTVGPTITAALTSPEAEEEIAVNPNDGSDLVAAISDFSLRGGYNTTKYSVSSDNGSNWVDAYVPLDPITSEPITGDGQIWEANSDPVVAFDDTGHVYLSNLYLKVNSQGNVSGTGLYVSATSWATNFAFTQAATYPVSSNPNSLNPEEDKPWITVDDARSTACGRPVYVTWTRFTSTSDYIVFSRSLDCGKTWSGPLQVSDPGFNGAVQGSQVAVGPAGGDGVIYVAYEVFFVGGLRAHFVNTSADGGATWNGSYQATPLFNELSFNSKYRKNSFASLAVSSTNNFVYLVYADQPSASSGSHIEFLWSSDSGVTFSSPLSINDTTSGQRLMPSVVTDSTGTIHTSWFDTRNSTRSTSVYDIYAARSTKNGGNFSFNTRVTSSSINAGNASFIGDYGGNGAGSVNLGGVITYYAHPVWTNGGFNGGQLQTSALH
jgi:hypothetical protein